MNKSDKRAYAGRRQQLAGLAVRAVHRVYGAVLRRKHRQLTGAEPPAAHPSPAQAAPRLTPSKRLPPLVIPCSSRFFILFKKTIVEELAGWFPLFGLEGISTGMRDYK